MGRKQEGGSRVRGCDKGSEEGTEGRELASRNKGETVKMERKKMTRGIKERRRVQRESCRVFKRRAAEEAKQVKDGERSQRSPERRREEATLGVVRGMQDQTAELQTPAMPPDEGKII